MSAVKVGRACCCFQKLSNSHLISAPLHAHAPAQSWGSHRDCLRHVRCVVTAVLQLLQRLAVRECGPRSKDWLETHPAWPPKGTISLWRRRRQSMVMIGEKCARLWMVKAALQENIGDIELLPVTRSWYRFKLRQSFSLASSSSQCAYGRFLKAHDEVVLPRRGGSCCS